MQNMTDFIVNLLSSVGTLIMQEPYIYFLAIIILFIVLATLRKFTRR